MTGKDEQPTASRKNAKNSGKVGPGNPPVEHQFKPGNPGRPKGSRNKLGERFLEDMLKDWEAHGPTAIVEVRETKPDAYLKVVASILPKDLNINMNNMDDMSDDELIQRIRRLDSAIRPFLDAQGEDGAGGGDRPATAH